MLKVKIEDSGSRTDCVVIGSGDIKQLTDPKTPLWDPVDSGHGMCFVTPNNSKEEM